MYSYLRRHFGSMDIIESSTYVYVKGIDKWGVFKDIGLYWETSTLAKYMFMSSGSSDIKLNHFFLPDFIFMMRKLYETKRTYIPKRTYEHLIELLLEKTWLGQAENGPTKSIINESSLGTLSPFPLKDYQIGFNKHYGLVVPAYRLNGYMLDAGTGSGKTMTSIEWAEALGSNKVIVVCPPNVVDSVWKYHLRTLIKHPKRTWLSTESEPLSLDYDYYVVHFNQLSKILDFVKLHQRDFKKSSLILDESHHLNKTTSDRSTHVGELGNIPQITNALWMSATAITAVGVECIPFLRMIDKFFTKDVEEGFKRIFGKNARKANEILLNRMSILKYHIPKQDLPDITTEHHDVLVKMPDAKDFTLPIISKHLRDYMMERSTYYETKKSEYIDTYLKCINLFKGTLQSNELTQFGLYQSYVDTIKAGYDAKTHKELSMFCNQYERKVIIPRLPNNLKEPFRQAKSVVKYPQLKALGEALGLLGKYRVDCHVKMVDHIDFESLIDSAKKKVVIFTSYLEVVATVKAKLENLDYTPIVVDGSNSKNLPALLKEFNENPDANPLITTYQSLSTGVPLTAANRTLYLNYPFRDAVKVQADGRTARLGQDQPCDYFGFLLDTGSEPNISTRNQDIMEWSASQVSSILGTTNLDLDALSTESIEINLGLDCMDDKIEPVVSFEREIKLPPFLYHGSRYKQSQLMPGFKRSGIETRWDKYESNHWLYVSSSKDEAVLLGIASAAEKQLETNRFKYDLSKRTINFTADTNVDVKELYNLEVYVYTLAGKESDNWLKNINPVNNIDTEYKTESTITDSIIKVEKVDVRECLRGWTIRNKI